MEPINTRDPAASALAYLGMEWPLALGHRYRPRQGCTCENTSCPAPGAHPLPAPFAELTPEGVCDALEQAPGAALIARTERFDAITLPRYVAMAAMVQLDRISPVPCILRDDSATLLVLPATGRYALVDPRVALRTGPGQWTALPPSHQVRWETPPWIEPTLVRRQLLHGGDVGRVVREIFNYVKGPNLQTGASC